MYTLHAPGVGASKLKAVLRHQLLIIDCSEITEWDFNLCLQFWLTLRGIAYSYHFPKQCHGVVEKLERILCTLLHITRSR